MYFKMFYIALLFVKLQCTKPGQHFDQKKLVGRWVIIKNQINYPSLQFNSDSTAIFRSRADTVYYFNFLIKGDSLILKDINDNETINRIKRLDDAQLVFYNLLEHEKKQVYNRKE